MRQYVGLPYREGGRDREGVDCWGLVRLWYLEQLGICLPDYVTPRDPVVCAREIDAHRTEWGAVTGPPCRGDIVLLRQFRVVSHVGVMVDERSFLHCEHGVGTVLERIDNPRWSRRIEGYARYAAPATVVSALSLLNRHTAVTHAEEGTTIQQIVEDNIAPAWRPFAVVEVHGQVVPRSVWPDTTIRAGACVNVHLVPQGGARNILRTILTLAVMVWAGPLGPGFLGNGAAFFSGMLGTSLAVGGAVATAVGLLAINALIPAPKPVFAALGDLDQSNVYSISRASNRANHWGAVPIVLGEHRVRPPYAALPYTTIEGEEQYLHCLFAVQGLVSWSDLRIGETLITDFDDVTTEITEGAAGDPAITIFPDAVFEEQLGIELTFAGGFQTRTTPGDADGIILDVSFPKGLAVVDDAGNPQWRAIAVNAEISPAGAGIWGNALGAFIETITITAGGNYPTTGWHDLVFTRDPADTATIDAVGRALVASYPTAGRVSRVEILEYGSYYLAPTITLAATAGAGAPATLTPALTWGRAFRASTLKPVRYACRLTVPSRQQYDVRIRRISVDPTTTRELDETWWTAFRAVLNESPVDVDYPISQVALRIRASGQLTGVIDQFNGIVTSRCLSWNGAAWVADQETSNPADLLRFVLQHPANANPLTDAEIDLDAFQDWHDFCDTEGFTFNAVLDATGTLWDRYRAICAAGRATPLQRNGLFSVLWDDVQTTPVQVFTPRNSRNYQASRVFVDQPHAVRARFVNADTGWLQDERPVYADGYDSATATKFEEMDLFGVTDADQVWKLVRYWMACAQWRQKQFQIETDAEHVVCTRGDLVLFQHDVPLLGLIAGRVTAVTSDWLTLDEPVTMELGTDYGVMARKADGTVGTWDVVTVAGTHSMIQRDGGVAFDCEPGDLYCFGEQGAETIEALVHKIEPMSDLSARLTLLPYSPDVYTADAGPIPPYTSQVTLPPELRPPAPPRDLRAAEYLYREGGELEQGATLTWYPAANTLAESYEVQVKRPNTEEWEPLEETAAYRCDVRPLPAGIYEFRVRGKVGIRSSAWATLGPVLLQDALLADLDTVGSLAITWRGGAARLTWAPVQDIRDVEYEVRLCLGLIVWDLGTTVYRGDDREYTPEVRGWYLVRAVSGEAKSGADAAIYVPFVNLQIDNVVAGQNEIPTLAGTLTGDAYYSPALPRDVSWDHEYTVWDIDADLPWAYEWDDTQLPEDDGWDKFGSLGELEDGRIKLVAGEPTFWTRTLALPAYNGFWTFEAKVRISGEDSAFIAISHATRGITVNVPITGSSIAGRSADMIHKMRHVRLEMHAEVKVYLDDELIAVYGGTAYAGANDMFIFGRGEHGIEEGSAQYWSDIRYCQSGKAYAGLPNANGWTVGPLNWLSSPANGDYLLAIVVAPATHGTVYRDPGVGLGEVLVFDAVFAGTGFRSAATSYGPVLAWNDRTNNTGAWFRIHSDGTNTTVHRDLVTDRAFNPDPIESVTISGVKRRWWIVVHPDRYWLIGDGEIVMSGAPPAAHVGGAATDYVLWGVEGTSAQLWRLGFDTLPNAVHGLTVSRGGEALYTIDSGDIVELGQPAESIVSSEIAVQLGGRAFDLMLSPDLLAEPDLLRGSNVLQQELAVAELREHDGTDWGEWATLVPGTHYAEKYNLRLRLTATPEEDLRLKQWAWEVDMPDLILPSTVATLAVAERDVTWAQEFQVAPVVQGTIQGEQAGDHLSITNVTVTGCDVSVYNAGNRVERVVYLIAQGY